MWRAFLKDQWKLLSFRRPGPGIREHQGRYLIYALLITWLAGIGRYWDHPRADWWQYAGLGSVAYVFVLALIIFLIVAPLNPKNFSYRNTLLFVSMTSAPALLYAIPVEKFMSLGQAARVNACFLGVVALWRVLLYNRFLVKSCRLGAHRAGMALLLPLVLIVLALTLLNLNHVVFSVMGGIREADQSVHDLSYSIVLTLTLFSVLASPFILVGYLIGCAKAFSERRDRSKPSS